MGGNEGENATENDGFTIVEKWKLPLWVIGYDVRGHSKTAEMVSHRFKMVENTIF